MKKYIVFGLIFLLFLTIFLSGYCFSDKENKLTTIFLVRHAEKVQDNSSDPPLTSEGKARALELAYILEHVSLDVILATPYKRTQQTALPTAESQSLPVTSYKPGEEGSFLKDILSKHRGGNILIIGHSNTIPELANHLCGSKKFSPLDDNTYDNIFIASVPQKGPALIAQLRFGKHTPEQKMKFQL